MIVRADSDSTEGFLQMIPNSQKNNVNVEIKNLLVTEVNYPKIFFKRIRESEKKDTADKFLTDLKELAKKHGAKNISLCCELEGKFYGVI